MRWQQRSGKQQSGDFSLNYHLPTRLTVSVKSSDVLDLTQNQNQTLKLDKWPDRNCGASSEFSALQVRARELLKHRVMSRAGYWLCEFIWTWLCEWLMPGAVGWCVAVRAEEGRKRGGSRNVDGTANHKNISLISGGKKKALNSERMGVGETIQLNYLKLNCRTPKKHADSYDCIIP